MTFIQKKAFGIEQRRVSDYMEIPQSQRREQAMFILEELARTLQAFNADHFYMALEVHGFSEEERIRLVGACFRTGQSRRWLERTNYAFKSRRNKSHLQNLWLSKIWGLRRDGTQIPEEEIKSEYSRWKAQGMEINDRFAKLWAWQKELAAPARN
jgi:hypothetical protein